MMDDTSFSFLTEFNWSVVRWPRLPSLQLENYEIQHGSAKKHEETKLFKRGSTYTPYSSVKIRTGIQKVVSASFHYNERSFKKTSQ